MLAELRDKLISLRHSVMRASPDNRLHLAARTCIWLVLAGLCWFVVWQSAAGIWRLIQLLTS